MNSEALHTEIVRRHAARLGFDACGIARAALLEEDALRLESWLHRGLHAGMGYMERSFDERTDPRKLVPGAQSIITLLLNYYPATQQAPAAPNIAKYAWGLDYHDVIRAKLNEFLASLREEIGDIDGRGFVDSAPVLERAWAQKSGLGWVGKNANLLTRSAGSFFFIATLITDLKLQTDAPYATDYCGTCTRCMDACPTEAIIAPSVVDASRCISYLTIELKDELIPEALGEKMHGWMFGCDICQDVCPWNRFAQATTEVAFSAFPAVLNLTVGEWESMDRQAFSLLLKNSPIKRSKWQGIQRNLKAMASGKGKVNIISPE